MANLQTAMDSAFWDQPISTPRTLEGSANSIPGEPFPLDAARASRALRIQQLSFFGLGFPLGIIPSYAPSSQKELGSFSLQSLLLRPSISNWWLGLVGQFRPKKLISDIRREFSTAEDLELSVFKAAAKHVLDKSLYSIALCSQLSVGPSTSLLWSTERHGDKKGKRSKFMLYHKLPSHDITLEAAWPQLFIDHKGQYWDVPESVSLNMASLASDSGLRYRFGIQKNGGQPENVNVVDGETPAALMPGLCAKAAVSYEQSKDFWRKKETKEDLIIKTDKGSFWRPAYDVRLREPHAAISAIIGGTCVAWFGGKESSMANESQDGHISVTTKKRSPLSADLFGSACFTVQHGKFRRLFADLTRVDVRLDASSVSGLAKSVLNTLSRNSSSISLSLSFVLLSLTKEMEPNDTHQLPQFSTHFHHPTVTAAAAGGNTSSSAPNGLLPPYYNNNSEDGNGDGGMVYPHSVASSVVMSSMESAKRKRGRPRKYGTPEQALAAKKTAAYSNSKEKRKQREQQHLGSGGSGSPYSGDSKKSPQLGCFGNLGQGFTPHVISVAAGEDVGQKIMLFMQQSKREICILSASGSISNASLRQPATAGGFITYEGRFEIVSLCGSYVRTELGGRTGGLSVCLSSTDGQIIGGVVGGPLKAAGPVQVIVGTFQLNSKKDVSVGLKGDSSGSKSASPVAGASLSSVGIYTPVESYGRNPVRGNDDLQTIGGTHFMIQPGGTHVSPTQATEWRDSLDPRSSVGYDATGRTGRGGNQSLVNGDYDQIAD